MCYVVGDSELGILGLRGSNTYQIIYYVSDFQYPSTQINFLNEETTLGYRVV